MIWYKVGAADETPGKSGLAHFLEHLMFKGTAKNPAGQFSQVVARIGGQENAFTSNDYTGYFQRVPSDQLKTVMEFEADRMTGLVLTDAGGAAGARRHSRGAESARRKQSARAARRADRRRAVPQSSLRQAGDRLAPRDGAAFPRRRHRLLSPLLRAQRRGGGDRRRRRAGGGAQACGGDLRQGRAPQRHRAAPAAAGAAAGGARARSRSPTRASSSRCMQRAYLVPSFATAKPGQSEALEVLAHILGSGSNSRLYRALVVDKQVAVSGRRLVRQLRARHVEIRRLWLAAPGRHAAAVRGGSRRGDRRGDRQGRYGRGTGAHQVAADRRCDLCAGQPGQHGALVWRGADDRRHRRRRAALARPHPRRHRRRRCRTPPANGSTSGARSPAI